VLVGLALVVASCGGGDDETSHGGTASTAAGGTGTEGGGAGGTVAVTMGSPTEYALVPEPGETAAGAITFTVANQGTIARSIWHPARTRSSATSPATTPPGCTQTSRSSRDV
jgi:hypothetical protein